MGIVEGSENVEIQPVKLLYEKLGKNKIQRFGLHCLSTSAQNVEHQYYVLLKSVASVPITNSKLLQLERNKKNNKKSLQHKNASFPTWMIFFPELELHLGKQNWSREF